jgi:hypothetical protein
MSYFHSGFPNLKVYEGEKGEKPVGGAFYKPKWGDSLSKIAYAAYGSGVKSYWKIINLSAWNQDQFDYLTSDRDCNAPRAKAGEPKFLPLCPPYREIWVPSYITKAEPAISIPEPAPGPTGPTQMFFVPTGQTAATVLGIEEAKAVAEEVKAARAAEAAGPPKTAIPWFLILIAVAAGGTIIYKVTKKKKRGKK